MTVCIYWIKILFINSYVSYLDQLPSITKKQFLTLMEYFGPLEDNDGRELLYTNVLYFLFLLNILNGKLISFTFQKKY